MTLLDALSAAADEITRDLAPGSVELRLRGRDPDFVVTPPPAEPLDGRHAGDAARSRPTAAADRRGRPRRADQRPPARAAQGRGRGGRGQGGPLGQRLAGPGGRRRPAAVRPRPAPRAARQRQADQAALHRLGALAAPLFTPRPRPAGTAHRPMTRGQPCLISRRPNRSPSRSNSASANVRIAASDRTDTVVEVRPSDESDESDVQGRRSRSASTTPTARSRSPGRRRAVSTSPARPGRSTCPSSCPAARRCPPTLQVGRHPQRRPARGVPVQDLGRATSGSSGPARCA